MRKSRKKIKFLVILCALVVLFIFVDQLILQSSVVRLESPATCNIPFIDPFSKSGNLLIEIHGKIDGEPLCIGSELKFQVDGISSTLIKHNPKDGFWNSVHCCYTAFYFNKNETFINGPECHLVIEENTKIPFEHANLDIKCKNIDTNVTIYRDQFHIFQSNQTIEDKVEQILQQTTIQATDHQPNIIVIGLDTVNHANFVRYMTKSHNYLLEHLHAIEFHGHNKIGRGTLENLLGFLTGCKVFHPFYRSWDINPECELIFEEFNRLGYRTFHFEDTGYNARELYPRVKRPTGKTGTHYNNFDFMEGVRIIDKKEMGNTWEKGQGCFDNQYALDIFVDNILHVANAYQDRPYFAFLWTEQPAHFSMRNAKFMDGPILRLLTQLKSQDLIRNTIIFVISDHGPWHGAYINTPVGHLETLTPLLYVSFPDWFQRKYSLAFNTIETNSKRLTTPYDLYETWKDLANLSRINNEILQSRDEDEYSEKFGQSLFLPVPLDRNCDTAHIPYEYCICVIRTEISNPSENEDVKKVVKFSIDYLNSEIEQFSQCAKLEFKGILQGNRLSSRIQSKKEDETNIIQVIFKTYPVNAEFQTTVNLGVGIGFETNIQFLGKPIRTNEYGKQSNCIANWKNATYVKTICSCI